MANQWEESEVESLSQIGMLLGECLHCCILCMLTLLSGRQQMQALGKWIARHYIVKREGLSAADSEADTAPSSFSFGTQSHLPEHHCIVWYSSSSPRVLDSGKCVLSGIRKACKAATTQGESSIFNPAWILSHSVVVQFRRFTS